MHTIRVETISNRISVSEKHKYSTHICGDPIAFNSQGQLFKSYIH